MRVAVVKKPRRWEDVPAGDYGTREDGYKFQSSLMAEMHQALKEREERFRGKETAAPKDVSESAELQVAVPTPAEIAETRALSLLEQGQEALARAVTYDDAQNVLAQAKVVETATRALHFTENTIRDAETLRVRSERRVGELLGTTEKRKAGRPPRNRSNVPPITEVAPSLADLGVSRDDSARFQKLADLPDEQFEEAVSGVREEGGSVTSGAVLRKADPASVKRRHLQLSFDLEDRLRSALEAGDVDALFAVAREILG